MEIEDAENLEELARLGNARAFGQLIRTFDDDLRRVAWNIVRSPEELDDVMQESYEKAFRSIRSFEGRASMKTWLHAICYRTAIDHVNTQSRRRHESDGRLHDIADRGSTAQAATDRMEIEDSLAALAPEQRVLLLLTAGLGYSVDETAEIMGLPRGTVASRVRRAKRAMTPWEQS